MRRLQGWLTRAPGLEALEGGMIRRTYDASRTSWRAIGFVNRVADAAEAADHHPDIDIR